MLRRQFITLLGGAATAWPLAARAQQGGRMRRVGVLIGGFSDSDPEGQVYVAAFREGLRKAGWIEGRNLRIDIRYPTGDLGRLRAVAAELVGMAPDVIFAQPGTSVEALRRLTRTIPVVFTVTGDPVLAGFVPSLARPGGNITGFVNSEPTIAGKYLQLLKDIAPNLTRVAVIQNPDQTAYRGDFAVIESAARSFAVEPIATPVRDAAEIERAMTAMAREPNGGLIFLPDNTLTRNRDLVVALAAKHRLPAVYSSRVFVEIGGLLSYGTDRVDSIRRAATYVDRILKGEKPADLPVQLPIKFEMVVNLKAATALGLTIPPSLFALADEVIQ